MNIIPSSQQYHQPERVSHYLVVAPNGVTFRGEWPTQQDAQRFANSYPGGARVVPAQKPYLWSNELTWF